MRTILLSIQSLLGEPNNASPLNTHAAELWNNQVLEMIIRTFYVHFRDFRISNKEQSHFKCMKLNFKVDEIVEIAREKKSTFQKRIRKKMLKTKSS